MVSVLSVVIQTGAPRRGVTGHPGRRVLVARSQPEGAVSRARYIVVEGPIGVGKTTLARILAEEWQARAILEQVDDNPFLRRFYAEPEKAAFQAQLFFLLTRYRQQQELAQQDLFRQSLVADYLFAKDLLFAQINLDSDELALYRQLFNLLGARLPKPDLVVYLQAPVETLVERVHRRGIDFERKMSATYLGRLADAYSRFFYGYDAAPLLIVNSERLNFVDNHDHVSLLLARIASMRGPREFFNLAS